jgi:hypothetical protein
MPSTMTSKITIEEPIPGNSLSFRRQQTKISKKSTSMIRQLPVFDIATTKPTKTKNQKQKQSTRPSQYQLTMFAHSKDLAN